MKTYKVYTPLDSIVVLAPNEEKAKERAYREILAYLASSKTREFDAEEIPSKRTE